MNQRWKILAAPTAARVGMGFQFQAVASAAPFLALLLVGPMAQAQGWPATMLITAALTVAGFLLVAAGVLRAEVRAAGMGVFYTVFYLGASVFPALAGALYDASGRASSTLWLAVGCALSCIPAVLLLRALTRR